MTNEQKSKVIHETLFPDDCWHEWESQTNTINCRKCPVRRGFWAFMSTEADNPNYFATDLPDSVRVRMVEVAIKRFASFHTVTEIDRKLIDLAKGNLGRVNASAVYALRSATIAEAIYQLIIENSDSNE